MVSLSENDTRDDKRLCVVGLQGSGKSEYSKNLARSYIKEGKQVLIIDVTHEYDDVPKAIVYRPKHRTGQGLQDEVEAAIKKFVLDPYYRNDPISKRVRLVIFDESSRYFPSGKPLPPNFGEINDMMRHMGLSIACIARRIVQMHVDIGELAHFFVIYRQSGINDMKRLNEYAEGLDDAVKQLPDYFFILMDEKRHFEQMKPVKIVAKKRKKA